MADDYLALLHAKCQRERGVILLGEIDAQPVGFIAVHANVRVDEIEESEYEHAYISDVFVTAAHRGRGIGSTLLAEAQAYAKIHGARWLRVDVRAINTGAQALYERLDFKAHLVTLEKAL